MDANRLTRLLKTHATKLGFHLAGVSPAQDAQDFHHLVDWISRGHAAQMDYFPNRLHAYQHPRGVFPPAVSLLLLAFPYRTQAQIDHPPRGTARVASYAWGSTDYHDLIHERLQSLITFLKEQIPTAQARGVVDSAPLLEREFAQLAGLGWRGKNTLLLNKLHGSYFFLAALLTDQFLAVDPPHDTDHCGSCTACLDACPTQAFPQPGVLDASRCISYLTIEHRAPIPIQLRHAIGDWLFGCDICQQVCPWNRLKSSDLSSATTFASPHPTDETPSPFQHQPRSQTPLADLQPVDELRPCSLIELLSLDNEAFRKRFQHSPLWRPRRRGLLRNACIVLGNQCALDAQPILIERLSDQEPLIRGAAAWALHQLATPTALASIQERLKVEQDPYVIEELSNTLSPSSTGGPHEHA
jgi:epoxyqueuosine reductase